MIGVVIRIGVRRRDSDGKLCMTLWLERPPIGLGEIRDLTNMLPPVTAAGTAPGTSGSPAPMAGSALMVGQQLFAGLAGHPEIQVALTRALGVAPDGRSPLLVQMRPGSQAEEIPWETVCAPDGTFLGLDGRFSVARVVESEIPSPGAAAIDPPLRIAALLSSLDITAVEEWRRLVEAIDRSPVPVELLLVTGEPELEGQVIEAPRSGVRLTTLPEPEAWGDLQRELAEFGPHILHFFCHGSIQDGPHLELATKNDWRSRKGISSVFLEAGQIAELGDPVQRPWLAVLNCCQGGAAAGSLHSLARDLVTSSSYAAVVAMREPVLSEDATSFSVAFYDALLTAIGQVASGGPPTLDWTGLLVPPRKSLVLRRGGVFSRIAADSMEWTLPVLYLRPEDFTLSVSKPPPPGGGPEERGPVTAPSPETAVSLETLRRLRTQPPPGTPPSFLADLDRHISELERQLVTS
jgi:hypothetical protein